MKNIVLVLSHDANARKTAHQCMQQVVLSRKFAQPRCKDHTFIKIVTTEPGAHQILDTTIQANHWLSAEEAISVLAEDVEKNTSKKGSGILDMDNLARSLHEVGDTLPYLGMSLDIVFCVTYPEENVLDSKRYIPVTGALKRLVDWHNGNAYIVKLRNELSPLELQLVELGHCQIVDSVDELNLDWPGWRGKITVTDHIENRGHLFSNMWLDCDDWDKLLEQKLPSTQQTCHNKSLACDVTLMPRTVCGRTVEVLQEVDLRTFPFFLLDSWKLHLHTCQGSSEILVQYIQSLEKAGLLARLRVYPDSKNIPVCGSMNLSTAAWKDRIISNIENLQEPPEVQVTDDVEFLYFLLLPKINLSNTSSAVSVVGQVLLTPHQINRNMLSKIEHHVNLHRPSTKKRHCYTGSPGDELILDERGTLELMLDLLKTNTRNVHSEYQGDAAKGGNASDDILEAAANVQAEIISAAFYECKSMQELMQDGKEQQFGLNIKWSSEATLDTSKCPEKLAMQVTEASSKMLQSFPSMDSLTASSPLSVGAVDRRKNSADFEVCDVLQCFNSDGTFKTMPTCPVKLKGHGLCRVDSLHDSRIKMRWPDCQLIRFHDVYYYNSETDLSLEKRYTKVRDRGYFQDTRSSFVSPVKKNTQPKPAHSVSPVRCLQRRSASAQLLLSSSRPNRISPRKHDLMGTTFKQPVSHLHSPRKLQNGMLCSSFSSNSLGHSSSDLRNLNKDLVTKNSRSLSRSQSHDQVLTGSSSQDHRKRSLTFTPDDCVMACKNDNKLSALASPFTLDALCPVRRSPRRSLGSLRVNSNSSANVSSNEKVDGFVGGKNTSFEHRLKKDSSHKDSLSEQASAKMKRSDRHKLKLQRIIGHVLKEKGIKETDTIHAACSRNLFNVSMVLLKTLTTSQNLTEEMKTVVFGQVTQIINLEKRRCGLAL